MIFIASDHAGFEAKNYVAKLLKEMNENYMDLGTNQEASCHYPEYAIDLAKHVIKQQGRGILLCGSGIGVSIVANRFAGIRAALCRSGEEARLSREHNDSNVLCIGGRISDQETIKQMIELFLNTSFSAGRHRDRISMFDTLGEKI